MRIIPVLFTAVFAAIPLENATAAQVIIDAHGLEPAGHTVYVAIFNDPAEFNAEDSRKGVIVDANYLNVVATAASPAMRFSFEVPEGDYGVKIFYDVDGDKRLGANFLGIPNEPYGFSNNARGLLSAPMFEDARFNVSGPTQIRIDLK